MAQIDPMNLSQTCEPSNPLDYKKLEDRKYYTDFSKVRNGRVLEDIQTHILFSNKPTCQLFTGHIGCGKSTELRRLKFMLESEEYHVIFFESDRDLEIGDVDISDILISIARQANEDLARVQTEPEAGGFKSILEGAVKILMTEVDVKTKANIPVIGEASLDMKKKELSLSGIFGKLTVAAKDSPEIRSRLRQYLEPRTNNLLEAINRELLLPAIETLSQKGQKGLVIIVDNLDRVESTLKSNGKTQPEYLFADRGNQLMGLNCHIIYTIPLGLRFSNEYTRIKQRFGSNPQVLTMVPVKHPDGALHEEGMAMLRQMVLQRAFPEDAPEQRLNRVGELFESGQTLDRLCSASGGHVRNLLLLLQTAIQKQRSLPISSAVLEDVILDQWSDMALAISDDEWEMLKKVKATKKLSGDDQYHQLLRSMFVFEYYDASHKKRWFDINPYIAGSEELK